MFCPCNKDQHGLVLFWTPLIWIVWTKPVFILQNILKNIQNRLLLCSREEINSYRYRMLSKWRQNSFVGKIFLENAKGQKGHTIIGTNVGDTEWVGEKDWVWERAVAPGLASLWGSIAARLPDLSQAQSTSPHRATPSSDSLQGRATNFSRLVWILKRPFDYYVHTIAASILTAYHLNTIDLSSSSFQRIIGGTNGANDLANCVMLTTWGFWQVDFFRLSPGEAKCFFKLRVPSGFWV